MKKLDSIESGCIFICCTIASYAILRIPAIDLWIQPSPLILSLFLNAITLCLFRTFKVKWISYLPAIMFLPVALGKSLIGWETVWNYLDKKYVYSKGIVIENAKMVRFSLEALGSDLSLMQVVAFSLIMAAGYLVLNSVDYIRTFISELRDRGVSLSDRINVLHAVFFFRSVVIITSILVTATVIQVMNYATTMYRYQGSSVFNKVPGLVGSLLLIWLISRELIKD